MPYLSVAIAKITNWLNDPERPYDLGRALYEQYGSDILLQALFNGGNSPYQANRLYEALSELNPTLREEVKPRARLIPELSEFSGPSNPSKKSKPDYDSLPEAIKEVTHLKNQHKRRADQLYIEIGYTESEEQRLEMALVMLADYRKVQESWAIIDNYRETGKVLEEKKKTLDQEIAEMSVIDLVKAFNNIPTYLSKDRSKVKDMPEGRHKAKVVARIQENELKLQLIERRLGNV